MTTTSAMKKCVLQVHQSVYRSKKTWKQQGDIIYCHQIFGQLAAAKVRLHFDQLGEAKNPDFTHAELVLMGVTDLNKGSASNHADRLEEFKNALKRCKRFEAFIDQDRDKAITMRVQFFDQGSEPFHQETYTSEK